jgi:protoporphyrinogen oxidase
MESVRTLIVGAGVSGLASAAFSKHGDYLVLERDDAIGGYCKTVKRDGFVWDYSGHFFHFKHPDIEAWLRGNMPDQAIRTVHKKSFIRFGTDYVDFPFQKNIHQLPKPDFIECLVDLYFARSSDVPREVSTAIADDGTRSFRDMLLARFGRGICEKFLIPYNEKLYATDLGTLDKDAMGRFFPHANLTDIVRNMREPDNTSYNSSFTYPEGGAIEYVKAIAKEVAPDRIALGEALVEVDLTRKVARTTKREIRFHHLISSAPFPALLRICRVPHDPTTYTWNKVLVYNLGFDKKGPRDVHWIYYPDRDICFYRVGFYDNIFDADRLSLYVEIGHTRDARVDEAATLPRVLADLKRAAVIDDHRLVAYHSVVMDPAYVHITQSSIADLRLLGDHLRSRGVYSIGRYGGWTYCSIEDNIVEARALAEELATT